MENIAINAGRKLFAKHIKDYTPEDPYYETYTDDHGRERRRKACVFYDFNFFMNVKLTSHNNRGSFHQDYQIVMPRF